MLVGRKQESRRSEKASDDAYARPSCHTPAESGTESADTAPNEEGGHEDGVHTVGGLRQLLEGAALITDLQALCSDVCQNDGYDESYVAGAKQPC